MWFLQPHVKPHCWSIGKSGYARSFHQISPDHQYMHVVELSGGQRESKYHAQTSRRLSKQIKLPMSQPELSLHISKVTIIQFCHPSRQTTHARQLCVIIALSEALNKWSPHHPHHCWQISTKMLTLASLISDPMYQKSRGCGLQNCHPLLGVAISENPIPSIIEVTKEGREGKHISPLHIAWVLQPDFSLPLVSAMNFLEIDLWQV